MGSPSPRSALQVQAFLGHCIQHCLLMRPAMCCFRELCAFIDRVGNGAGLLLEAARREVRIC